MNALKIVRLHFKSGLHLGTDISGIGLEDSLLIAHSDTLFSCLINSYAELHSGNLKVVEKLLEAFCEGHPPFRISSAFPFEMQDGLMYYLPKPLIDPPLFYDPSEGQWAKNKYGKLIRTTQLIPIDIFQNWLKGQDIYGDMERLERQNIGNLCAREIRPQHARDRLTEATSIYHTGLVHFHHGVGLYFLVELNDESFLNWSMFETVLRFAGRNGLGGRRSLGNGVFEATISELDEDWNNLFDFQQLDGFINLSLYLPDPQTLGSLGPVAYQLVPRQGWCYSSITPVQTKRQKVTMFGEGSVFRNKPKGSIADVTPDNGFTAHNLYRYGIPILLPIKILEKEDDLS